MRGLLKKVEPFPTDSLKPCDTGLRLRLGGRAVSDRPGRRRGTRARADGRQGARDVLRSEVPGDTQRNLQVDADYSAQTFKHILVPIWLLAYNYGSADLSGDHQRGDRPDRWPVSVQLR